MIDKCQTMGLTTLSNFFLFLSKATLTHQIVDKLFFDPKSIHSKALGKAENKYIGCIIPQHIFSRQDSPKTRIGFNIFLRKRNYLIYFWVHTTSMSRTIKRQSIQKTRPNHLGQTRGKHRR